MVVQTIPVAKVAYNKNIMKNLWLLIPTQFPIQGQWWSILSIHLLHSLQWCTLGGFIFLHLKQYDTYVILFNTSKVNSSVGLTLLSNVFLSAISISNVTFYSFSYDLLTYMLLLLCYYVYGWPYFFFFLISAFISFSFLAFILISSIF